MIVNPKPRAFAAAVLGPFVHFLAVLPLHIGLLDHFQVLSTVVPSAREDHKKISILRPFIMVIDMEYEPCLALYTDQHWNQSKKTQNCFFDPK